MLLHQLGEDLVLALELLLEGSDGAVLGVGIGLAAFVVAGEGGGAVVEELLLPGVEEVDGDAEFFTDVGDRDFLDEVESESGDLLFRGVVAALPSHGFPPREYCRELPRRQIPVPTGAIQPNVASK